MPWSSEQNELNVNCPDATTAADGPWVTLKTKELCLYTVVRDDGGSNDRWLIDVIRSSDGSRKSEPHPRYMLEHDETVFTFPVEGTYAFLVRVANAETVSPTDIVHTDHYWKLDGVDL